MVNSGSYLSGLAESIHQDVVFRLLQVFIRGQVPFGRSYFIVGGQLSVSLYC